MVSPRDVEGDLATRVRHGLRESFDALLQGSPCWEPSAYLFKRLTSSPRALRLCESGGGDRHVGRVGQPFLDQRGQLRVAIGGPPAFARPGGVRRVQAVLRSLLLSLVSLSSVCDPTSSCETPGLSPA